MNQSERIEVLEAERIASGVIVKPLASLEMRKRSSKPKRQNFADHYYIDRLNRDGVITDDQWQAGVHIRYWHDCIALSSLRSRSIDTIMGERGFDAEAFNINKLNATDLLMKTMLAVQRYERTSGYWLWQFCHWLCIDDMTFDQVAKLRKMRASKAREETKGALDILYGVLDENNFLFWQR